MENIVIERFGDVCGKQKEWIKKMIQEKVFWIFGWRIKCYESNIYCGR